MDKPNSSNIKDSTFVFTGDLPIPREEAQLIVSQHGGRYTSAVSGRTTFLVVGESAGTSKLAKARTLGTRIISADEFMVNFANPVHDAPVDTLPPISVNKRERVGATWAEEFRPTSINEIIVNKQQVAKIVKVIRNGESNCIFVSGPPGTGKTTAVAIAARACSLRLIEFNASMLRSGGSLKAHLGETTNFKTVGQEKRIILMDELDGMLSDKGGIVELMNIIKGSETIFVLVLNDTSNPRLKAVLPKGVHIRFLKANVLKTADILAKIATSKCINIEKNEVIKLASLSLGDIRYAVNLLQSRYCGNFHGTLKIVEKSAYESVSDLFKGGTVSAKLDIFFEDFNLVPLLIHENYVRINPFLLNVSENLSIADTINYNSWGLLPVSAFYVTSATHMSRPLGAINFPGWFGSNSRQTKFSKLCLLVSASRLYKAEITVAKAISDILHGRKNKLGVTQEEFEIQCEVTNLANFYEKLPIKARRSYWR